MQSPKSLRHDLWVWVFDQQISGRWCLRHPKKPKGCVDHIQDLDEIHIQWPPEGWKKVTGKKTNPIQLIDLYPTFKKNKPPNLPNLPDVQLLKSQSADGNSMGIFGDNLATYSTSTTKRHRPRTVVQRGPVHGHDDDNCAQHHASIVPISQLQKPAPVTYTKWTKRSPDWWPGSTVVMKLDLLFFTQWNLA